VWTQHIRWSLQPIQCSSKSKRAKLSDPYLSCLAALRSYSAMGWHTQNLQSNSSSTVGLFTYIHPGMLPKERNHIPERRDESI